MFRLVILLAQLSDNRLMRNRDEFLAFEDALAQLAQRPDPATIPQLFAAFDDQTEHHEVMWGLLHYIEYWEAQIRAAGFIQSAEALWNQAPEWAELILERWLRSDRIRPHLYTALAQAEPAQRTIVHHLLRRVAADSDNSEAVRTIAADFLGADGAR